MICNFTIVFIDSNNIYNTERLTKNLTKENAPPESFSFYIISTIFIYINFDKLLAKELYP